MSRCSPVRLVWIGVAMLSAITSAITSNADDTKRVMWLSGPALENQFAQSIALNWQNTPLKTAISDLARLQRVPFVLDRRVDPSRSVQFSASQVPLAAACEQLATQCGLGFCRLGPLGYFGPKEITARLRTVAVLRREEAQRLAPEMRAVWSKSERWQWDDFATPRELLTQLAQKAGLQTANLELLPHDLWAAADLPPMSLVDRVTFLTAQFDLTFRYDDGGRTIALVPLPQRVVLERSYPAGTRAQELAKRWAALVPNSQIEVQGQRVLVRGPLEDHERLDADQQKEHGHAARSAKCLHAERAGVVAATGARRIRQAVAGQDPHRSAGTYHGQHLAGSNRHLPGRECHDRRNPASGIEAGRLNVPSRNRRSRGRSGKEELGSPALLQRSLRALDQVNQRSMVVFNSCSILPLNIMAANGSSPSIFTA